MSPNLTEMKEEELLKHWTQQAQTNLKVLKRINTLAARAKDILNAPEEFYADSKDIMSSEEIRQCLKSVVQIKENINNGNELLDTLEQFQRVYKMRASR